MTDHIFERDPAEQLKGYKESRHIRIFVSFLNWAQINIKAGRIWQCNNQLVHGWVRHYTITKELQGSLFGLKNAP